MKPIHGVVFIHYSLPDHPGHYWECGHSWYWMGLQALHEYNTQTQISNRHVEMFTCNCAGYYEVSVLNKIRKTVIEKTE